MISTKGSHYNMATTKKQAATSDSTKTSANQVEEKRDSKGRFAVGHVPTTGFHTNPERANTSGRWDSSNSISFWYNKFLGMTDADFKTWRDKTPASERTQAQKMAYSRFLDAQKNNRLALDTTKEITDRTEGKAPQVVINTDRESPLERLGFTKEDVLDRLYGKKPAARKKPTAKKKAAPKKKA